VAQLAVVEARVAFQTIHCGPVFDRDLDQFGFDLRCSVGNKGREAPAGVVQRTRDDARLDAGAGGDERFCRNREAKDNVRLDLARVGRAVERADLDRAGPPHVVEVDRAVASPVVVRRIRGRMRPAHLPARSEQRDIPNEDRLRF